MNKNLSIINQNNKLMLKKSKSLMSITNGILSKDDWIQRLWDWADENGIPEYRYFENEKHYESEGIPRNSTELKSMFKLSLSQIYVTNDSSIINTLPEDIRDLMKFSHSKHKFSPLTQVVEEIGYLTNLSGLDLEGNSLKYLPKEIGNLNKLSYLNVVGNELMSVPKEIGNISLRTLFLANNDLSILPYEITKLTQLVELGLEDNPMLSLTESQQKWIFELMKNGCDVTLDDRYENLYGEFELRRRYEYLDEFNIGREVPITPEMLDDIIPSRITDKLAENEITFEEYLDEVSEYLEYSDKVKFNNLVKKIFDKSFELGNCFERNITFDSYQDNQLVWKSTAFGEDKKLLIQHWAVINMFVKEIFGLETKIVNIAVSIE